METIADDLYTANECVSFLGVVILNDLENISATSLQYSLTSNQKLTVVITAKLEYNEHDYYSEFMNVPGKVLICAYRKLSHIMNMATVYKFTSLTK